MCRINAASGEIGGSTGPNCGHISTRYTRQVGFALLQFNGRLRSAIPVKSKQTCRTQRVSFAFVQTDIIVNANDCFPIHYFKPVGLVGRGIIYFFVSRVILIHSLVQLLVRAL